MASSLPAAPLEPVLPSPAGLGAEPVPRDVVGAVEVVTAKRIAGWAVDRTAADRRLTVEVLADGVTLGRVTAERPRTDLARSRKVGGSGLGLAICKHIIEAHNQTIHVRSKVDVGTTFGFTLQSGK